MQVLAWMWCITFAMIVGSWTVFGVSALAHVFLLGAIAVTVGTFETAKRKSTAFLNFRSGYTSYGRGRIILFNRDKNGNAVKVPLDPTIPWRTRIKLVLQSVVQTSGRKHGFQSRMDYPKINMLRCSAPKRNSIWHLTCKKCSNWFTYATMEDRCA